jgi:hypothetical protein
MKQVSVEYELTDTAKLFFNRRLYSKHFLGFSGNMMCVATIVLKSAVVTRRQSWTLYK